MTGIGKKLTELGFAFDAITSGEKLVLTKGVEYGDEAKQSLLKMSKQRAIQSGEHLWVGLGEPQSGKVARIFRAYYQFTEAELKEERRQYSDGTVIGEGVAAARIQRFADELREHNLLEQVVVFGHNHPFVAEQEHRGSHNNRRAAMMVIPSDISLQDGREVGDVPSFFEWRLMLLKTKALTRKEWQYLLMHLPTLLL